MDPYPRQYQKELQGCNSFNPSRPLNPTAPAFDSSPNSKNTTLPFKLFQNPGENIQPFPKKFQIPLSLSPSKSLSQFCPKPLSLSHPPTTLVRLQNAPLLRWQTTPTSSESSKLSGTLSFSLYLRMPTQLGLYLYCTAWFQSPSQPPVTVVTASLKYSHINGFWTEKKYV